MFQNYIQFFTIFKYPTDIVNISTRTSQWAPILKFSLRGCLFKSKLFAFCKQEVTLSRSKNRQSTVTASSWISAKRCDAHQYLLGESTHLIQVTEDEVFSD